MDLERLAVRLRPRKGWEAVDLGFALVRAWWRPVYAAWLMVAAPVGLLLAVLFGGWGVLLFWWLLPLAETMPLHVLSRAVFGDKPSVRDSLRAFPGLLRRAWPELLLRRINPSRTAALPVCLLEGLDGSVRRRRVGVLSRYGVEASSWAATFFVACVPILLVSLAALLSFLLPGWLGVDWELFYDRLFAGAQPPIVYDLCSALVVLALLVVHPLHVASGFALYLAQRTHLEGWDLEIAFRRLARRVRAFTAAAVVVLALKVVLTAALTAALTAGMMHAPAAVAQTSSSETAVDGAWITAPRDPNAVADQVLENPELRQERTTTRWRLRGQDDEVRETHKKETSTRQVPRGLAALIALLAKGLEVLLWLALGGSLAALVVWALRRLPSWRGSTPRPETPDRLFGLDLRPESLPDDVAAEAEALWRAGRHAEALGLLYRAALARLVADGATLRTSFTEFDCVRVARSLLPTARAEYFVRLTRAWQSAAYAHRTPTDEEARALWTAWSTTFDVAAVEAAEGDAAVNEAAA